MVDEQWVYDFAEGSRDMRELLGGKGANVAEMTRVLGADRVPAGFTITTEACVAYMQRRPGGARRAWPSRSPRRSSASRSTPASGSATTRTRCWSPCAPARASRCPACSTRSSTSASTTTSVEGLARATENERFAWDSYRRFVQMFGNVVARHRRARRSRTRSRRSSRSAGVKDDTELDVDALQGAHRRFKALYRSTPARTSRRTRRSSCAWRSARCSTPGPASARSTTGASTASPTTGARRSTSSRWCSATRATRSATGVAFSRDEVTGAPEPSGDFLVNAQGEDVVSGVRNTARHRRAGGRACPRRTSS